MAKYVEGEKIHICIPIADAREFTFLSEVAKYVADIGFVRFQIGDTVYSVADTYTDESYAGGGYIIIDRLVVKCGEDEKSQFEVRYKDSASLAFQK